MVLQNPVWGFGFKVEGLGYVVWGFKLVWFGFRVQGLGSGPAHGQEAQFLGSYDCLQPVQNDLEYFGFSAGS